MECEICGNQTLNENKICDACKMVKDIYENLGIDVSEALEKTKTDREDIKKIPVYYLKKQYKEVLEIATKYAEINSTCAVYLGQIYANGNEVGIDGNMACHWYKVAASLGNIPAAYNLGILYQSGKLIDQDLEEAFKWFESAAQHGNRNAMYEVAICYEEGKGITKDENKALEWYKKAYESKKKEAAFKTAYLFQCGGDSIRNYEEAAKYYQLAITNNSNYKIAACCNLANLYKDGQGVEQDIQKAVDYYNQSIELGGTQAMLNLADLYEQGKLIKRDLNKALQLYEKAEKKGRKEAKEKIENLKKLIYVDISSIHALNIQELYKNKEEYKQYENLYSQRKYLEAMEKALEYANNDAGFAFNIGIMYNDGNGVSQDLKKAKGWLENAAQKGDARAQYQMGKYYQMGREVEKDPQKAFELFYLSAHQGWASSVQEVAECYSAGKGIEKDEELALAWHKKAIELGQKNSYFHTAWILHIGSEKVRNYQEAARYYKLAIEYSASYKAASYCNLAALYADGLGVKQDWNMAIQYYQISLELYERAEKKAPEEQGKIIQNKINSLKTLIHKLNEGTKIKC